MTVGSSSASAIDGAAELGRRVVEREAALLEQGVARERVAVGVQAAGRQPDDRVAGRDRVAGDERVGRDRAEGRAAEVEAVRARVAADELGQHGELAAGDLDARALGAGLQALGDLRERGRVGLLDGEVVEHRDRLGADADEVVDVHRDAVDADRAQAPGLLGDDELGADAVGAQRDRQVVGDAQHAGVVAGAQQRAARPAGVDRAQHVDERAHARVAGGDRDSGGGVGVLGHRRSNLAQRSARVVHLRG